MLKDIYFGVQGALLILAGCAASEMCYGGILSKVYAALIIAACVMALYSSFALCGRMEKKPKRNEVAR